MRKLAHQKGFTLVELAIVMTIIGLLIGGILKGQELMQNARVTATIAAIRSFEAATTTFRDAYNALPGDMANATIRLPGCTTATCDPIGTGAGNNQVGTLIALAADYASEGNTNFTITNNTSEGWLFWRHLLKAGLIGGVADQTTTMAFSLSHPATPLGGGFLVRSGNGAVQPLGSGLTTANTGPAGLLLMTSTGLGTTVITTVNSQVMQAKYAAQIDRKYDEGSSAAGSVFGAGNTAAGGTPCASAQTGGATPVPGNYQEGNTGNICNLVIRIQG